MTRFSFLPPIHSLGLIGLGSVVSIMLPSPILPLYLTGRGLSPAHVGAVIGIMSLALIVTELTAATATSFMGRRTAVLIGLAGSVVMLGTFPLITSLIGLYLNRFVFGAVRGMMWPVAFAEITEITAPEQRAASFATFWLYFGLGTLVGPALGGVLGENVSLAAPFYAGALVSLLTMPFSAAVRPLRDARHRHPLAAHVVLFRTAPHVIRTWAITLCSVTVFGVYTTFLPLHAAARGLTPVPIGLIFTGGAVAFIIGQWLLQRFGDRVSLDRLLLPAFLIRGLGVAAVPLLSSFTGLLVVNFISSIAGAAVPVALSMRIASRTPPEHLVPAMGGFNASADMGFFVGPVAGGLLAGLGLHWAFVMVLPVTATAILLLREAPTRVAEQTA